VKERKVHSYMRFYFLTELAFLGDAAVESTRSAIALGLGGNVPSAELQSEKAVHWTIRAAHAARYLYQLSDD
jgi:hypothetical protein